MFTLPKAKYSTDYHQDGKGVPAYTEQEVLEIIKDFKSRLEEAEKMVVYEFNGELIPSFTNGNLSACELLDVVTAERCSWFVSEIVALRSKLAEVEKQEPVAWLYTGKPYFTRNGWKETQEVTTDRQLAHFKSKSVLPLYTAPVSIKHVAPKQGEQC